MQGEYPKGVPCYKIIRGEEDRCDFCNGSYHDRGLIIFEKEFPNQVS